MGYLQIARESVGMYEVIGNTEMVELQHLLAVIIGNKKATPELTGKLAQRGVRGLVDMSTQELESVGLTSLEALRVHASLIFSKKLAKSRNAEEFVVRSPEDCADYLYPKLQHLKQEHLVALFLDTKNKIIKCNTIFIGSLDSAIVHPRDVFREAVRLSSGSIVIAHNHPSGDPAQSNADIEVTKRMVEAGKLMGIEVLDHIIIGDGIFTSLREKGYIKK